jgi:hypothetical protein
MDMDFTPNAHLAWSEHLMGFFANMMTYYLYWYEADFTHSDEMPTFMRYIRDMAKKLTSKQARAWLKKNRKGSQHFPYYVVHQMIQIYTLHAQCASDYLLQIRVNSKGITELQGNKNLKMANKIYDRTMDKLDQIFLGSREVPECTLWKNSAAKRNIDEATKRKQEKLSNNSKRGNEHKSGEERDPKKQKPGQKKPKGSSKGDLKWTGNGNLNLPKELWNRDFRLCKSYILDGEICPHGERCHNVHQYCHELDKAKLKVLHEHVKVTDELTFDHEQVSQELLASL